MGFFLVMKAEIVRSFIIMRRYWFRTLTGMAIGYGMLMVLIIGFMSSRESIGEAMDGRFADPTTATNFVLGFILGMFAFGVVGMFTQGIQGMAQSGVLEQLCMSPHGLIVNFLAKATVSAVTSVFYSGIMVWLVTVSVSGVLYFDLVPVFVLLTLTFINLLGFGFMMGGLTLVFKQVGQVAILIRMALFALAIFAREELLEQNIFLSAFIHALPITDAAISLKYVLIYDQGAVNGEYASVFTHPSFYFLIINCVVWTSIGMAVFKTMENWSRSRGTLGTY